uniref:L1 transposable element RRM domain-containing protein n=1 Tax=Oryzias latipes TaxID=8090 RepID=A0A3B3HYL6_ORYLA
MPRPHKTTDLAAKTDKTGNKPGNETAMSGEELTAANEQATAVPPAGILDVDKLVERISTEVHKAMLKAVEEAFDKRIEPVLRALQTCTSEIAGLGTRVSSVEQRVSDHEDICSGHDAQLAGFKSQLETALAKIDDLENRSRRCNIRVVGLPEGSAGSNPVLFVENFLPKLVDVSFKGGAVKVDRCHRVPAGGRTPGKRPRVFLVKLHNFQDKVRIMQAARKKQALKFGDAPIMIFDDFSAAVSKKREEFSAVKRRLRERGLQYAMLYPSTLKVWHGGRSRAFERPKEAAQFLNGLADDGPAPSLIRIMSWNCKGLNGTVKRNKILCHVNTMGADVMFLQETHLKICSQTVLRKPWVGHLFHSKFNLKSRDVAI